MGGGIHVNLIWWEIVRFHRLSDQSAGPVQAVFTAQPTKSACLFGCICHFLQPKFIRKFPLSINERERTELSEATRRYVFERGFEASGLPLTDREIGGWNPSKKPPFGIHPFFGGGERDGQKCPVPPRPVHSPHSLIALGSPLPHLCCFFRREMVFTRGNQNGRSLKWKRHGIFPK